MLKYKNIRGTFIQASNWISLNSEAIIREDSGTDLSILLKDLAEPIRISRARFDQYFESFGEANEEDLFEFDSKANRISKSEILKLVRKHFSGDERDFFEGAIKKADQDAFTSAGSTKCLNHKDFERFERGELVVSALQDIGDPVFNRRSRWSPVADIENWKSNGFPAPIGIRHSDYAPLKHCNEIFLELLIQVFSMDYESALPEEISRFLGGKAIKGTHTCAYCGDLVPLKLFGEQDYKSKEQALNFCHRDPSALVGRTRPGNVYFGHTSCNRIQGGLSERERIFDGLRLLVLHADEYLDETIVSLIEKVNLKAR
jgi:hypothetical protein